MNKKNLGKRGKSVFFGKFVVFLLLAVAASTAALYINSLQSTDNRSSADSFTHGRKCESQLSIKISGTGLPGDAKESITTSLSYKKYYVHVRDSKGPCSTTFDVVDAKGKVLQQAWSWKVAGPSYGTVKEINYGAYASNMEGIARIDLWDGFRAGAYPLRVKPAGSQFAPSNEVVVNLAAPTATDQGYTQSGPEILAKNYWIQKPGYSYIFTNTTRQAQKNIWNDTPVAVGRTMIQFEEKVKLGDLTSLPMRFTKEQVAAYWGPQTEQNMRWHNADNNTTPPNSPNYGDFVWSIGHETYGFDPKNPTSTLRIIDPNRLGSSYLYKQTNPSAPTYTLFKKKVTLPYMYDSAGGQIGSFAIAEYANPQMLTDCAGKNPCPNHHWRMRMEMDTVTIKGSRYQYSGPAVRVDYYEISPNNPTEQARVGLGPHIIRESWYFVKEVGLVKVEAKTFNRWGNASAAVSPSSASDPDFMADRMAKPAIVMELDSYFTNPQLKATLTKIGGGSPGTTLTLSKAANEGYQLRVDPPYTGWLESRLQLTNGTWQGARKWMWAEKGVATVTPEIMKSVPANTYVAQFRVWVPDDKFPSEQRITDTDVPWSNTVTSIVR